MTFQKLMDEELLEFETLSNEQQSTLVKWCEGLSKIKSFNLKHTSYGLKHLFEKESFGFYITNGAFKKAMLEAGFNYTSKNGSINWNFNVSEKSIKAIRIAQRDN